MSYYNLKASSRLTEIFQHALMVSAGSSKLLVDPAQSCWHCLLVAMDSNQKFAVSGCTPCIIHNQTHSSYYFTRICGSSNSLDVANLRTASSAMIIHGGTKARLCVNQSQSVHLKNVANLEQLSKVCFTVTSCGERKLSSPCHYQ